MESSGTPRRLAEAVDTESPASPEDHGRARRLQIYLRHMFPPAAALPYLMAYALAADFGLQALAGQHTLRLSWRACAASVSVFLFGLLLRVCDEFKDADSDRALARAGDPRYRNRPTVTGVVTLDDLGVLRTGVILTLFALNLPLGFPYAVPGFLVVFGIVWLSSRWFFWPAISRHLLLALATHNPLPLVFLGYVAAVHVQEFGTAKLGSRGVALLIGLWLPWTAWETSRKIRIPADATAYQTYSKVLGWRNAPFVPAACVLASAALLTFTLRSSGLPGLAIALLWGVCAVVVTACLRFRIRPSREHARLRPFVDLFGATVNFGVAVGLAATHGVRFN